jgi:hypothetical protein
MIEKISTHLSPKGNEKETLQLRNHLMDLGISSTITR